MACRRVKNFAVARIVRFSPRLRRVDQSPRARAKLAPRNLAELTDGQLVQELEVRGTPSGRQPLLGEREKLRARDFFARAHERDDEGRSGRLWETDYGRIAH